MKKYILPAVLLAAGFSLSTIGFQKQEIKAAEESGTEVEETSREQVKISPTEGESDGMALYSRSEERRVGKECRSRGSPCH